MATADERLAAAVLPQLVDLPGRGWRLDEDAGKGDEGGEGDRLGSPPGGRGEVMPDCLPADYPDERVVAEAEASFVRAGVAVVVAQASVFRDEAAGSKAWAALATDSFARCFAESVGLEVDVGAAVELLGPVVSPESRRGRTAQWRAVFTGADDDALRPAVLRVAVIGGKRVVVLVWGVDIGRPAEEHDWDQLIERAEGRTYQR